MSCNKLQSSANSTLRRMCRPTHSSLSAATPPCLYRVRRQRLPHRHVSSCDGSSATLPHTTSYSSETSGALEFTTAKQILTRSCLLAIAFLRRQQHLVVLTHDRLHRTIQEPPIRPVLTRTMRSCSPILSGPRKKTRACVVTLRDATHSLTGHKT